jgi:RNA polymerase sigma factor for flagellar operon FliA
VTDREPVPLRPRAVRPPDPPEVLERFHEHLELVNMIAGQVRKSIGPAAEHDELLANGREGLLEAARRYDASRGVPFRLYANYRVRGAMIDGVRKAAALPRRTYERLVALQASSTVSEGELEYSGDAKWLPPDVAEAEDLLAEHLSGMAAAAALATLAGRGYDGDGRTDADTSLTPEEELVRAQLIARVKEALGEVSQEAAAVVRRHYLEGERLEDIARDYEMSKSWASRLLTRTTARLAKRLKTLA